MGQRWSPAIVLNTLPAAARKTCYNLVRLHGQTFVALQLIVSFSLQIPPLKKVTRRGGRVRDIHTEHFTVLLIACSYSGLT